VLVDKKPFIYVWRPFYRFFHDRVIVHYLERLKAFFLSESRAHLQALTSQLSHIDAVANQIEQQVLNFESNERNRWAAFEQLYLCWLSDPDRTTQMGQLVQAERRNEVLRADLAGRLAAFDARNQAVLDRLGSMDIQNRNLLETLIALDRNHTALSTRIERLEVETRSRWRAMEQLLTAVLSDPDRSMLASIEQFHLAQEIHKSPTGDPPRA
jgi:hypothetical protein